MVTGKVPFDADTPVSVALKHMQETPKDPIKVNPAVPLAVNKIVMKAMKKDPGLRYQTASEMLKDLTLALKNPDGEFVNIVNTDEEFPTQILPTLDNKDIEDKIKEQDKKTKNKKQSFFKKHPALTVIIVLIIIFALSLGGTSLIFNMNKDVQIPNLVGLTEDEVKEKLKGTKLTYTIVDKKYNDEVETDKMISQKPEYKENYKIKGKRNIELVISLGQKIVKVPKVTGMEEGPAKEALEAEDLEVEVVEEFDKKVQAGVVISQDVDANTEVGAGTKVTITVSKGLEMTTVPNVVGKGAEEAKKELQDAGLTVTATLTEQDTTKDDGKVLKQSLEAGTSVEKGATLTITVNQIQKLVDATATINLKSVLNYTPKYTNSVNTGNTNANANGTGTNSSNTQVLVPPKNVKVKVVVGNDTVYNETHKEDETNIKVNFKAVGTVTIKLYVDDVNKGTEQINLSETQSVTFE